MQESVTLSLNGNTTSLSAKYFPPINVYEDSEIALLSLQTYNAFANINESNNSFEIFVPTENVYEAPKRVYIGIRIGCYEFEEIKDSILKDIDEANKILYNEKILDPIDFKISINKNTFKTRITCNYIINFDVRNSLASILGFKKIKYTLGKTDNIEIESEKSIDINPVNTIKVMCNIARGSFHNSKPSHSIYEFFPNQISGTKIVETPNNLIYYPLTTSIIDSINIDLVDQELRPLHDLNERVTIVLHIKRYLQ